MTQTPTPTQPLARNDTVWVLDQATSGPSVRFPGAWKVEKVNPRTLLLIQPNGAGLRRLKCDRSLVSMTEPQAPAATIGMPYRAPWSQGQIVRWAEAPVKAGGTLFVVISDDGGPAITRLVLLGNTTGRYWRRVPVRQLEAVSLDDILRPEVQR